MKLSELIKDSLKKIEHDRKQAQDLLDDMGQILSTQPSQYPSMGGVAAKMVEVLQRSNEQQVKIIAILAKKASDDEFGEVSEEEATEMYEDFEEEDLKDGV